MGRRASLIGVTAASFLLGTVFAPAQTVRAQVGINLAGISYWASEHPFSNLAQHGSRWRTQPIGKPFTWNEPLPPMTKGNYPKEIPAGTAMETFIVGSSQRGHLPSELIVLYDGQGQIGYALGGRLKKRLPGRDLVADVGKDRGPIVARLLETDPENPLRNIRVYEPDQGSNPATFRKPFLDRWSDMSALRFMDWMETNNSKITTWAERPQKDRFTQAEGGVALEHMIELSNTLDAAPWFNMPHLADDNYIRNFAEQVKRDLDPELPVYVEYSNEVWNRTFEQARYAAQRGRDLKLSQDEFQGQLRLYSQRTSEILKIWEDVFGQERARVLGVYAAQSVNPWTSSTILQWGDAREHADVLAIAPYFGASLGDPKRQHEVANWSLDQLFEALGREIATDNKQMIAKQVEVAKNFNLRLVAYEGGQHLVGHGGVENNKKLEQLFHAANRDPRMKDLYLAHLNNWRAAGGELYVLFNSMGPYTKWGSWGLLETEAQKPSSSPKWEAVQQYIRESRPM